VAHIILIFFVSLYSTVASSAHSHALDKPRRVVGYYASWSAYKGLLPDDATVNYLTHLIYAFANISDAGAVILGDPCIDVGQCDGSGHPEFQRGNFSRLLELRNHHPHLKVLVAIGGWNWSKRFSDVAASPQSRENFVRSAIEALLDPWPDLFDGFDLDWEFPVAGGLPENVYRTEDKENFTLLIAEFRRQLDQRASKFNRSFFLTAAVPAAQDAMKNIEISKLYRYVDWLNVMTYDYHTGSAITHFNSPLYSFSDDPTPALNVHATIQAYLRLGIPPEKLVIGVPFFGYRYNGVVADHDGLFQHSVGHEYFSFRDLSVQVGDEYRRFWQSDAQVPWIYNQGSHTWLTYDDEESILAKVQYVRRNALGGIMIWELSGDDGTLLRTIASSLNK
jgi:chitinase